MINSSSLDKFAILLSGVCLVHCLITPVLITLLPILSINAFVKDLLFHQLILWLILPTSCIALFLGCRKHKQWLITGTGILGIAVIVTVAFFGHEWYGFFAEKFAVTAGGLILTASHFFNFRACQNVVCSDNNCTTRHHH